MCRLFIPGIYFLVRMYFLLPMYSTGFYRYLSFRAILLNRVCTCTAHRSVLRTSGFIISRTEIHLKRSCFYYFLPYALLPVTDVPAFYHYLTPNPTPNPIDPLSISSYCLRSMCRLLQLLILSDHTRVSYSHTKNKLT